MGRDAGRDGLTRWGRFGRRPIRLLALVALIDAVDRGILPGVLNDVQDDLGFGDTAAGVLATAFILAGLLVSIPAGFIADRYRRTRIIAAVLLSWGAISAVNAAVRSYWQFLAVRATLGVGETIDNPSSQSLIADYYPAEIRGRAYAFQRVAPIVGGALGIGLGGLVGGLFGWRWAFLIVGVPGSLLALAMWRLPEPRRGESDSDGQPGPAHDHVVSRPLRDDIREIVRIRTLIALIVGSAIVSGAAQGLQFWAAAFYDRHTSLSEEQAAGATAGLILLGALVGTWIGGLVTDRSRERFEGAPMLVAGVGQVSGGFLLMVSFLPVPLWLRMPAQVLGVALLVAGLPALAAMTAEVVPATIRGISFSVTTFLSQIAGAASPLLIGFIADRFAFEVDGETKGHLANAFFIVSPLVMLGGLVVLRGRRFVAEDTARAAVVRTGSTFHGPSETP